MRRWLLIPSAHQSQRIHQRSYTTPPIWWLPATSLSVTSCKSVSPPLCTRWTAWRPAVRSPARSGTPASWARSAAHKCGGVNVCGGMWRSGQRSKKWANVCRLAQGVTYDFGRGARRSRKAGCAKITPLRIHFATISLPMLPIPRTREPASWAHTAAAGGQQLHPLCLSPIPPALPT